MSSRILRELKKLNQKIDDGEMPPVTVTQQGDAYIFNLEGEGLFSGALFDVQMIFYEDFEMAPEARFLTKIFHPSVDENGFYCSELLTSWKKQTTIIQLLEDVLALFTRQSFPTPRNTEAGELFKNDRNTYCLRVKQCIQENCKPAK